MILLVISLYYSETLEYLGAMALADFEGSPKMELVFVMVILPVTMNSI